ncbi:TolC family protein [Aquimarina addita]
MKLQNDTGIQWFSFMYGKKVFFIASFLFSTLVHSQTLADYINEAEQNNPELKAKKYEYEASLEKAEEVRSYENTSFGAGYFISEAETRTGAQKAMFSANQAIPWFGTLKARKNKEISTSEIYKNELDVLSRKIALGVKQKYYELYGYRAKEKILKEQKQLIENYKEILLSEVSNNKTSAVDVLKIEIALNELDNTIEILKGTMLNTETGFNTILDRDGFEDLIVPDNLIIPDEEPTMVIDDILYHPELLKYDTLDEMMNAQKKVNTKERMPGLSIGLDYVIVEERPDLTFDDNGKDIIMPKVSVSIPLFSRKYTSRDKQFELQQESYVLQRESAQNELGETLEKAINNRITARINFDTQLKNKIQAKQAEEIALSGYQTGQAAFGDLLEIQKMLLDFEIKQVEAIQEYFIQTAIINYLN